MGVFHFRNVAIATKQILLIIVSFVLKMLFKADVCIPIKSDKLFLDLWTAMDSS